VGTERKAKRAELSFRQYMTVTCIVFVLYTLSLLQLRSAFPIANIVCRSLFALWAMAFALYLRGWWSRWRFMVTPNRKLTVVRRDADAT
jgi:hypothetical protein